MKLNNNFICRITQSFNIENSTNDSDIPCKYQKTYYILFN